MTEEINSEKRKKKKTTFFLYRADERSAKSGNID